MEKFSNLYNKVKKANDINIIKTKIKPRIINTNNQHLSENELKLPLICKNPKVFNNKLIKKKNINLKDFLRENLLKFIELYLDSISLKNMMLTCKKFNKTIQENDELWYRLYKKKYQIKEILYEKNITRWRIIFLQSIKTIYEKNKETIKKNFLSKMKKNSYEYKKDLYFISNNLFIKLKPKYNLELNGISYKLKHIFTNKILSHVNFFSNFDQEYIDIRKLKIISISITESNLGVFNKRIVSYDIPKLKLKNLDNELPNASKICKIFYDKELSLSTFDDNLIFFLNLSMPICKICECIFDFMNGLHNKNLEYFDDSDSNFGLYDYSLLLNVKSWNQIFYSLNVNTVDFRNENDRLHYENNSNIVINYEPVYEIKTIALQDKINYFLIFDLILHSYKGDHVLCESHPLILKIEDNIVYEDNDYEYFYSEINTLEYSLTIKFKHNRDLSIYCMYKFDLQLDKNFIRKIFKNK